ncbi:hypothetical protein AHIS1636_03710 [Arthrobacter mangrovi]|uniref:Excalibur calcium-binding domain-containing protein n=2 Tax=Arthrobacter mangrovi TaxID=2966350 RepID=A0ABQ5MPL0_9MICC|nr:hypothetical protein AHIS1636_03710 [Arthrobacter mangrovi]
MFGVLAFVLGLVVTGASATAEEKLEPVTGSFTASPSPSVSTVAFTECDSEGMIQGINGEVYICTEDQDGVFLWMDRDDHDKVVAAVIAEEEARKAAEAKKVAEEKKAKEEAAEKAAAEKKAKAEAAKKAEAKRKALEERKAAEEAKRQARAEREAEAQANRYASCTDAANDGLSNITSGSRGYNPELDSDGDGVACEDSSGGGSGPAPVEQPAAPAPAPAAYYANCTAAKAAGAAPLYRGNPGYGSHLDSDGDGAACES